MPTHKSITTMSRLAGVLTLLCGTFACVDKHALAGRSDASGPPSQQRASPARDTLGEDESGPTVWLITYFVKPDQRERYVQLLDSLWDAGRRLGQQDSLILAQFRQTQILYSPDPEPDGTYRYAFLMNPVVSDADYDMQHLLSRMYPPARADSIFHLFLNAVRSSQPEVIVMRRR